MSDASWSTPAKGVCVQPGEGERLTVVTDNVRLLADASTTGGRLTVIESCSPPRCGPPLHRHALEDEFFYVVEGTHKFVRDGVEIIAEPGAFISCPKGSTHTFANIGSTMGKLLVICMPAGLEQPFRETVAAAKAGPLTPESLGAIFAKRQITFHGPPIG